MLASPKTDRPETHCARAHRGRYGNLSGDAAKNQTVRVDDIALQLCEPRSAAFNRKGWLWELKLDGFRLLVCREGKSWRLVYRRDANATAHFPEIAKRRQSLRRPTSSSTASWSSRTRRAARFREAARALDLSGQREERQAGRQLTGGLLRLRSVATRVGDLRGFRSRSASAAAKLLPAQGRIRAVDHVEEQGEALLGGGAGARPGGRGRQRDGPPSSRADWVKSADSSGDFAVVG